MARKVKKEQNRTGGFVVKQKQDAKSAISGPSEQMAYDSISSPSPI